MIGNPLRKQLLRAMRWCMNRRVRTLWLPFYNMNTADQARCKRFLARLDRTFRRF